MFIAPAMSPLGARGAIDEAAFHRDLARLSDAPTRVIGSDGYRRAVEYVASEAQKLGDSVEVRRHDYGVMMPVTESAGVTIDGATAAPVYPIWPAGVRMNATPAEGISGRLVYCGQATLAEIRPSDLRGNIAVIEASAAGGWQQVMYFGATAILVLGSDDVTNHMLREHELLLPANLPRFYVPRGPAAEALRKGGSAKIEAKVTWQLQNATNVYVLVKPVGGSQAESRGSGAILVSAGLESSGLVPDLAPGAGQAVQPAAALGLLRQFAANRPSRPMLFAFVGGDSMQLLGQRNMFMALADAPATWSSELRRVESELTAVQADGARLREVGGDLSQLSPTADRRLVDRLVKSLETRATDVQDELFRIRRAPVAEQTPSLGARRQELERQMIQFTAVRMAMQTQPARLREAAFAELAEAVARQNATALGDLDQSLNRRKQELTLRMELYTWLAKATGRNPSPAERDVSQRLIELHLGLDLSDGGQRAGPMFLGQAYRTNASVNLQDYRDWASRLQREFEQDPGPLGWWGDVTRHFDFEPLSQIRSPQSYLCASMALPTELAQAWGLPGMTWMTLDDLRPRRDTPADTLAKLDVRAILPQLQAISTLLERACADRRFVSRVQPKRQRTQIDGQVVSPSSGRPVPDLPRRGFLITYYNTLNATRRIPQFFPYDGFPYAMGVRRTEVIETDPLGRYRIEGLPQINTRLCYILPQAYRIEAQTGAIVGTSDLGKQLGELKQYADIRQDVPSQRLVVFDCEEFALVGLYDPRFLQDLSEVVPIDARRNAEPQRYNLLIARQIMAGFLEPGTTAQLLFRYGRVGNRLVLLNMNRSPESQKAGRGDGLGLSLPEIRGIGPLNLFTANDFWSLDEKRLVEYRKAGVSSTLIDSLHATARQQLDSAQKAGEQNDAVEMTRHANGAWANEARVYDATRALASDVIRAAIFLLMLAAPFSFCMERLLVGTPNVYKQIGFTTLIFGVMTGLLWSFHPAFKISSSPLIIILAFAIILMSSIVIWVVYGKFDGELRRMKSRRGSTEGASVTRASVMMSAVMLGIANMRKRKLRTALTSLTIVLITFAVLCFTSSTTYVGTTSIFTGQSSTHPGILLRQRGFRPLPAAAVQNFAASLGPGVQIVERWWNVSPIDPRDQINIAGISPDGTAGRPIGVALLGLSPGESALSRIEEVIGQEKFARLERSETDVIYLSDVMSKELAAEEGSQVLVGGLRLTVAGVFPADQFDQRVSMLSGESLAPLKYSMNMLDASGRRLDDSAAESIDVDPAAAAAEAGGAYEHLPASQFAIVPASVSRRLPNASLRNVAFRLADQKQVEEVSEELSRRFGLAMFAGYDDGVRLIAASNLADVSGGAKVAIPLLIGGMIIFNTMMGSIAERKREIHVYTSLGLAPMHVGALFVAEAMTYGLIGTVFGYIGGQGVGTILGKMGWLGGATLNYSGSSAMMTMGLILAVVFVSALVPARMASKVAAPSIDRSWKVPKPEGDTITAILPFTINRTAADGVLAYLSEYFDDHREGSIGKFSADDIQLAQDRETRSLSASIWLTPFDLGVRQRMNIAVEPSDTENIFEVKVELLRQSGDDDSWYRMNRPFLTEIRKQFLAWRSLSPVEMQKYVERSREAAFVASAAG
ncbi:MAG TPA: hypothetical protein PLD59_00300 [Tepidisphaeraceae bacterium]|nr:hypothetical protein [Tepidisphaeraceae bacterium]